MAEALNAASTQSAMLQLVDFSLKTFELAAGLASSSYSNWSDFGYVRTLLLYTIFPQARSVVSRIRQHVLCDEHELQYTQITAERFSSIKKLAGAHASTIKESYEKSLNIIAVAGAITAQIAITGLSLTNIDRMHWTAEAAFVISLITGLLSVYSACIIQVILGGMHSSDDVLQWLTAPLIYARIADVAYKWRMIPSCDAAMMLVAPLQLLNWSLLSLLVGIGIYYGLIFTQDLGTLLGKHASLAVLLVYIIFTTGAIASFALPALSDLLETTSRAAKIFQSKTGVSPKVFGWGREFSASMNNNGNNGIWQGPAQWHNFDRDAIVHALQASVDAQKASLSAQETLLRMYTTPSRAAPTF